MGNNASTTCPFPQPNTSNPCSSFPIADNTSNLYQIPGFCSAVGSLGDNNRKEYCDLLSSEGEWMWSGQGGSGCYYDNCNNVIDAGSHDGIPNCCGVCCGIPAGTIGLCVRNSYTGDQLTCCGNDLTYWQHHGAPPDSSNPSTCYSDSAQQSTCNPNDRDISTTNCQTSAYSYCTGSDLQSGDISWLERWTTGPTNVYSNLPPCIYAVERNLFVEGEGQPQAYEQTLPTFDITIPQTPAVLNDSPIVNAQGLQWVQSLMNGVNSRYNSDGLSLGATPGSQGYNSFQNLIYGMMYNYPGIGQDILNNLCTLQTTNRLTLDASLLPWCGCYMPNEQYAQFQDEFQINKECSPTCNVNVTIKPVSPDDTTTITCQQNVCLMDNNTINLINSSVSNNINFTQVCGSCQSSGCQCIISDTTIDAIQSSLQNVNLQEQCGTISCYQDAVDPLTGQSVSVQIPCDTTNIGEAVKAALAARRRQRDVNILERGIKILILIVIAIVVVLLVLLFAGMFSKKKKVKTEGLNPVPPSSFNRSTPARTSLNNQSTILGQPSTKGLTAVNSNFAKANF